MTKEVLLLSLIALVALLLIIECATEVIDVIQFFFYKGNSTAHIVGNEPFSISRSRRLVEQEEGHNGYSPVLSTQDRNANYPYILSLSYWMHKGKEVYPVLEWETNGKRWKAHYPYTRNWATGSEVIIHYNVNRPWKYSVRDCSLGLGALLKCAILILCGVLLIFIFAQTI